MNLSAVWAEKAARNDARTFLLFRDERVSYGEIRGLEARAVRQHGPTYVACSSWARPRRAMIDVRRGGSIINMSSILGQVAMQRTSIYVATKGALSRLTRSRARESAAHGRRASASKDVSMRATLRITLDKQWSKAYVTHN